MINRDLLTDLILKVNALRLKKGKDAGLKRTVIDAVNTFIGEDALDIIFINPEQNILIPDVFVMPIYNADFGTFLMDSSLTNHCPYGYTIEIKEDVFDKYEAEEITAVMIHNILQNVQSSCAKARFLSAYTTAIEKYPDEVVLDMFKDVSHSEVCFFAYIDICSRTLNVPTSNMDYVGTDEVLRNVGLSDAYDSYLIKSRSLSNDSPEEVIDGEIKKDMKSLETIIQAVVNDDILHYYEMIKSAIPLITLNNIAGKPEQTSTLGFVSRRKSFTTRRGSDIANYTVDMPMSESVMNPQNEIELRFQIDKIITEMRYLETEAERASVLFRIKQLRLKLNKTSMELAKKLNKNPGDKNLMEKSKYVEACIDELDKLRKSVVDKEVTPKHYGVFVQYPAGYEF